jgi:hypothetical protein
MTNTKDKTGMMMDMPYGPKTLSVQFTGNTKQYDYFIPPGSTPKVGDIILTSPDWGAVPNTSMPIDEEEMDSTVFGNNAIATVGMRSYTVDQDDALTIKVALMFLTRLRPAIVVRLHEKFISPKANRFYVQHIPNRELQERKILLKTVIERTVEKIKARVRLSEIVAEQAEMDLYRKVAETNLEAHRLIKILQGD